jgi:hypothetical protein
MTATKMTIACVGSKLPSRAIGLATERSSRVVDLGGRADDRIHYRASARVQIAPNV